MRTAKKEFYIYHIVEAIAGTLYRMAPRNRPRDMNKIMSYMIEQLESVCVDVATNRYLYMSDEVFNKWLASTLKGCQEFCNLNLSQNEWDNGISVDDESRPKFAFTSMYDAETVDSWKDDFIDLDAAIRNIYNCIIVAHEETDCFLCDYSDNEEQCKHCKLNYANYTNYYKHANMPCDPIKYDGWCKTSCPKEVAVCCKDCDEFDTCELEEKCNSSEFSRCSQYVINPERSNCSEPSST